MEIKHYLFLTAGILGIVCILKLAFLKKNKNVANNYFTFLIAILTIRQFNCLMDLENQKAPLFDLGTSLFNLILYIVLYLLLNKITKNQENKFRYSYPVILLILSYLTFNAIMILNNIYNPLHKFIIDFIYVSSMSYINFRLMKSFFQNEKSEVNFTILTANWLLLIVALFCLTPLKYLLQILSCLIDGTVIVNYKYQLINSIICIIIFVYLLIYPTNLEEAEEKNRKRNNSLEIDKKIHSIWKYKIDLSKLNSADLEVEKRIAMKIDFYIKRINSLDYDNNILLKKGTTISDLALELKIPKSHLNFIFKYNCTLSFVTFKNLIRIEKSKKLIESDYLEFNTLNSLAEKVGFKSYDPFFKSFKEVTGIGPMEYRISNKKNKNLI